MMQGLTKREQLEKAVWLRKGSPYPDFYVQKLTFSEQMFLRGLGCALENKQDVMWKVTVKP